MIHKWVRELIAKYSFITGCELKKGSVYVFYKKDEEMKSKKIPLRANKEYVENVIKNIKEDINYGLQKEERKKIIASKIKIKPIMVFS